MFTEEYESKGFPFRNFLLKLILVIIFVFLLVWLIPKFTAPKVINNNTTDLSPLTNQIFADNLKKMQDAATSYYTNERLPKEVGDFDKMTLSDMIGKKLLVPLIDKNNKACDVEKSYVKITKMDQEYLLKVNLKCSDQEDYILVHMGCYNYCDTDICAKKEATIAVKSSRPQEIVSFGGSSSNNGFSGTSSGGTSKPSGNSPTADPSDPGVTPPQPVVGYEYEYEKTTDAKYSDWTKWTDWKNTSCNTQPYGCDDNSPKCLKKLQIYKRKEKIGMYDKEYVASREEVRQTGSYQQLSCANYDYIIYNDTTYVTTTTYTTINYVTSSTQSSVAGWTYRGRKKYSNPPRSTLTTRYKFVGADFSYCNETCTTLPSYWYDEYTYNGSVGAVSSTSSSQTTTSSSSSQRLDVICSGTVTKTIPLYGTVTVYEKATRKEPLYGTVCYESTKTRKLLDEGKTTVKWSSYNDTSLLNKGYHYTGNTRRIK